MTLKEIIDNCGYHFRSLSFHTDGRWIAKGGLKVFGHWKLFSSDTPEKACYKLLDALNKNLPPK